MEANNVPGTEFETVVVRMLRALGKMNGLSEHLDSERKRTIGTVIKNQSGG